MDVSIAVSLIRGQMGAVVERAVNVAVETVLAEMLKVVGVKFEELKAQVKTLRRDVALKDKENDKMRTTLRLAEARLRHYQRVVDLHLQHRGPAPADRSQQRTASEGAPPRPGPEPCSAERDAHRKEDEDYDWTVSLQLHTEAMHLPLDPPPAPEPGQVSASPPLSPDRSTQADSSTLLCGVQVKQEQRQEEEEVICIKEEPGEEQEVMTALLLDCSAQQSQLLGEGQSSASDWVEFPVRTLPDQSPAPSYSMAQVAPPPLPQAPPPGVASRPAGRPWTKELSLYEEYKLRRNELRRRSLSRRREMEKTLPQPLLADLVRERREKTRLRVARWRAKRKLQACLSQAQAPGGAVFPVSSQQLSASCGSVSGGQPRRPVLPQCSGFLINNSLPAGLPFITPSASSSSSSLLLGAHGVAEHASQHAVTSSSCSSYPQVSLSQQSSSLTDADVFQ
ncbi:uncharacterized protein LOC115379696 [Myripristis murdjan]|uniref:uncharacterized protein LOC115379696 n=1 Tax=Myripristis murdjan TaxID=586833 RepID=UPI001176401E|nr:uncharacterized protein LOC115379696 [Myripristis murdjan]